MSDTELDLGALRALMDERASCVRTIEGAGMHDNYTDAARARDRKWTVECQLLNAFPAVLAAAGERAQLQARVAELERGEIKWAETCNDLRMMLDASSYVERHDAALKRAHAAEEQVAALQAEVERLRSAERTVIDYELAVRKYCGDEACDVDGEYNVLCDALRARAFLAPAAAKDARSPAQPDGGAT